MSQLPVPMFPVPAVAGKSAGLVLAVAIGLAIYLATRKQTPTSSARTPQDSRASVSLSP